MEFLRLKAAVEALLYVSDGPLPVKKLREAFEDDASMDDLRAAIDALTVEFGMEGRGIRLAEVAGGYQIITRPEFAYYVKKLQKVRPPKLSAQALETLAIIAYRQPIIKSEIEQIRGVSADGVMKTLMERRLIKIAGRQDVPGKPMMYATTNEFLQYFGLKDLYSLPSLRELERELGMEENSILKNLEPELPGLDGPELEKMADDFRAKRLQMETAARAELESELAAEAAEDNGDELDLGEMSHEEVEAGVDESGMETAPEDVAGTVVDSESDPDTESDALNNTDDLASGISEAGFKPNQVETEQSDMPETDESSDNIDEAAIKLNDDQHDELN